MMSAFSRPTLLTVVVIVAAALGLLTPARADGPRVGRASTPLHHRPPGATRGDPGPSTVIFPVQRIPLNFDHEKHAGKLVMPCDDCHDKAKTSRSATDDLFPNPSVCDDCHDSDHENLEAVESTAEPANCDFCHVGYRPEHDNRVERVVAPPPNLRFDHRAHADRNINCQQCHGAVQEIGLATREQLPRMRGCFRCHDMPEPARGEARGECTVCHLEERGRLKTSFTSGELLPPAWLHDAGHGPDWIERHKAAAAANSDFCGSCHAERECMDCHDGRVRPRRVHPSDWLNLHAAAAHLDENGCESCHRAQSFCITCHERSGVTWSGPLANISIRGRFHPPRAVWSDSPRTARHHAWEAQRNMGACISCHNERDCAVCHATTPAGGRGVRPSDLTRGVNPHPPGFEAGCRAAFKKNARPCLVCHVSDDPSLRRCR